MITIRQYLFALLDLRPELKLSDYNKRFWVGFTPDPEGAQTEDAFIVDWVIKDVARPTQDQVVAHWDSTKDRFIDPITKV